jgi:hypothetical protein
MPEAFSAVEPLNKILTLNNKQFINIYLGSDL